MSTQMAAPASTSTSAEATGSGQVSRGRLVAAATLIGIGAGSLVIRGLDITPATASVITLGLGLAFLTAHIVTRSYGLLVPGGILGGLGAGMVASQQLGSPEAIGSGLVVLGLGLGFLSIWAVGRLLRVARHHWWPLVPGGILTAVGASLVLEAQAIPVLDLWPVVLVAVGLLVLHRTTVATRIAA